MNNKATGARARIVNYPHLLSGRLSDEQLAFIKSNTKKPLFVYLRDLLVKEMGNA